MMDTSSAVHLTELEIDFLAELLDQTDDERLVEIAKICKDTTSCDIFAELEKEGRTFDEFTLALFQKLFIVVALEDE
jgi:hypothetical protein